MTCTMYISFFSGSAKFSTEPAVENIGDVNLKQLSRNIWMANEDTVISGDNLNMKNISLKSTVIIRVRISLERKKKRKKRCYIANKNQLFFSVSESHEFIEYKNVVGTVGKIIKQNERTEYYRSIVVQKCRSTCYHRGGRCDS